MSYDLNTLRSDLSGAIVAAVTALPLSLAFGVVSGLGAVAGLYGAVSVGFFAAVFGGTKTQVSGPTAPMAVAMSFIVANYADSLSEALTIVFVAGIMQVLLGALRVGSFVAYTPYSVVAGFMSGVGIIIVAASRTPRDSRTLPASRSAGCTG